MTLRQGTRRWSRADRNLDRAHDRGAHDVSRTWTASETGLIEVEGAVVAAVPDRVEAIGSRSRTWSRVRSRVPRPGRTVPEIGTGAPITR